MHRLIRGRRLARVRPGWYAQEGADQAVRAAVRQGGTLSCVSLFRLLGAWSPSGDSRVHARFCDRPPAVSGVVAHRLPGPERVPVLLPVDTAELAMTCLVRCLPPGHAVAVADSALRRRHLHPVEMNDALLAAGQRAERIARAIDPSAESGAETHMRLVLRSARIAAKPQVQIRDAGRVDFLVGDRLVIEVDSVAHHGGHAVISDRERDNALERLGFHVLRVSVHELTVRPERVLDTVRAVMARRDHRWSSRNMLWRRRGESNPVLGEAVDGVTARWRSLRDAMWEETGVA